jgi:hypothetical protein
MAQAKTVYERASEPVWPRSRDQILSAGALAALARRAAEPDLIPGLGPGQTRAVITCMSADGPETFTEKVATERGALIPAGLDRALRQPGACQHGADHLVATFGGQDQTFRLRVRPRR